MKWWALSLLTLLLLSGCAEQEETSDLAGATPSGESSLEQPYAGLDERPIRALSEEKVEDLLAGRGAGYALAAELNHYPGPRHALDLAGELNLSAEQEKVIQNTFSVMEEETKALGKELVDLEERLDRSFQDEAIDEEELARITDRIASVEGRLRAAHLGAHLDLKEILSADQVATYDRLRGYAGSDDNETHRHTSGGYEHRDAEQ